MRKANKKIILKKTLKKSNIAILKRNSNMKSAINYDQK